MNVYVINIEFKKPLFKKKMVQMDIDLYNKIYKYVNTIVH